MSKRTRKKLLALVMCLIFVLSVIPLNSIPKSKADEATTESVTEDVIYDEISEDLVETEDETTEEIATEDVAEEEVTIEEVISEEVTEEEIATTEEITTEEVTTEVAEEVIEEITEEVITEDITEEVTTEEIIEEEVITEEPNFVQRFANEVRVKGITTYGAGDVYSFNVDGNTYTVTYYNGEGPVLGTINMNGTEYVFTCSEPNKASPMEYDTSIINGFNWTHTTTNYGRDVFWNFFQGSNDISWMTDSNYYATVSGFNQSLYNDITNGTGNTAPTSADFKVTGGPITFTYDSTNGVQKSNTLKVTTGSSYIDASISFPSGFTLHYKNPTTGVWGSTTEISTWLWGTGTEFYFTASASANLNGTVKLSASGKYGVGVGYYVDKVGLLSTNNTYTDQVWGSTGPGQTGWIEGETHSFQRLAFPMFNTASVSYTAKVTPIVGSFQLNKESSDVALVNGNDCYNLAGARYRLSIASGVEIAWFTIQEDGRGLVTFSKYNPDDVGGYVVTNLPTNQAYFLRETQAPSNGSYKIDDETYMFNINSGTVYTKTVYDEPLNDPLVIQINKTDDEGNIKVGPSLAGAEFTIKYYDGFYTKDTLPSDATRTWVIGTKYDSTDGKYKALLDNTHKISGDNLYLDKDGNPVIPLGTITIEETKAPAGYNREYILQDEQLNTIQNDIYVRQITASDVATPSLNTYHTFSVEEVPLRTNLTFIKEDYVSSEVMAGIPFRLSLLDASGNVVESHIIVTDENGVFDSDAINPSVNTNGNDSKGPNANGLYDGLTPTGIWFSGSETEVDVNDNRNSLTYGTYMLEELPCTANKEKQLITPITFDITNENTLNIGTISNVPSLFITTLEEDMDSGTHLSIADDDVTVIDGVSYNYLTAGKTYTLIGVIIDKKTGKPLKDANGDYIVANKVFTTTGNYTVSNQEICGETEVTFNFDGSNMSGETFVIFQYLYLGDKSNYNIINANGDIVEGNDCIFVHNDINNIDQTGYFPGISTTAFAEDTEDNVASTNEDLVISDIVNYNGLEVGEEYTLTATLVDYETKEVIKDKDGNVITATKTFIPETVNGSVTVTFPTLDRSIFFDQKVVVFEDLYYQDRLFTTHADIEDKDQTIYFPEIGTTATYENGTHLAPRSEKVTIVDVVEYTNLEIDTKYVLKGTLMSKKTGEPVLDKAGNKVVATKEFYPEYESGTVEIEFVFDATLLEGDTVVVFESVYRNDIEVCVHADIEDEGQSVDFPGLETELTDKVTDSHNTYLDEEITLVDTCEYRNLIVGEEYTITGVLMNKDTGKPVTNDGKEITATKTFVAEKPTGVIEVEFKFNGLKTDLIKEDGTYSDIVCFESIYYDDVEFCVHADIEDKDQTVFIAELNTVALDSKDGDKSLEPFKTVTVTDSISYKKLDTNKTYIIEGVLMTKDESGNVVVAVDKNGNPVKSSIEFKPNSESGMVYMNFTFDTTDFVNKNLTVFQRVYEKESGELIATHEDIESKDQTVTIPTEPVTGDKFPIFLIISIILLSMVGLGVLTLRKNKIR